MAYDAITGTSSSAADSIASLVSNGTNTSVSSVARDDGGLGKDSFLQLLVTEMKYQDPLNPMSNKDSIAQLAQFSQLQQLENMNSSFGGVLDSVQRGYASSLIGKEVFSICEKLTALDFMDPERKTPFLFWKPQSCS